MRWQAVVPVRVFREGFYSRNTSGIGSLMREAPDLIGSEVWISNEWVQREWHPEPGVWEPVRAREGERKGIVRDVRSADYGRAYALTCDDDPTEVRFCDTCLDLIHESLWLPGDRPDHRVLIEGPVTVTSQVMTPDGKVLTVVTQAPHFLTQCSQIEHPEPGRDGT